MSGWFSVLTLLSLPALGLFAQDKTAPKDFTATTLESIGVQQVKPQKDARTGFVVGGDNATALIAKLATLAGQPIAKLEKRMRPGADSRAGFLGKDESLLDVLVGDNRFVVDELGLSHQDLARHLHIIGGIAAKHGKDKPLDIRYHGQTFRVQAAFARGFQESPFDDDTKANCNVTVVNLGSSKKLVFSLLVPHMVERYGFYEGRGTPYRVDPRAVLEVLEFIK